MTDATLSDRLLAGDPRAIARAISLIEDESPARADLVRRIFARSGRAYLIGVTGPPGAGKSTLVDRLIGEIRKGGRTVGVVAVDPTSPFSGGAILGDRVRMQAHAGDADVFIRSMATRGNLGGLARATGEVAVVLDAAGKDIVLIETVGVGQDEVDIVRTADVSIVTIVPGSGDEVQALKAGIMEIADIFVVNKADREGADRTVTSIEAMLSLHSAADGEWRPPVIKTVATTGAGVPELLETIEKFRAHTAATQGSRRRARAEWRLRELLGQRFLSHVEETVLGAGEFDEMLNRSPPARRTRTRSSTQYFREPFDEGCPRSRRDCGLEPGRRAGVLSRHARPRGRGAGGSRLAGCSRAFHRGGRVHAWSFSKRRPPTRRSPAFSTKRGPGMHHVALRVDDIVAALAELKARGIRLIDETPRPGAHGSLVAFLHPSSTHGVLVELKQPPSPQASARQGASTIQ